LISRTTVCELPCAANQRDELAPFHLITSSAQARIVGER
jgi:hypothetical protein